MNAAVNRGLSLIDAGGIAKVCVINTGLKLKPGAWFTCVQGKLTSIHVFPMACRRYDVEFKIKAIAAAEERSKQAATHQFKVDARRVREWCLAASTSSSPM